MNQKMTQSDFVIEVTSNISSYRIQQAYEEARR